MTGSLHSTDGRSVLCFERWLAHPAQQIWRTLTKPDQLTQWFPADLEMDLSAGGQIRFVFREGEGPTWTASLPSSTRAGSSPSPGARTSSTSSCSQMARAVC